MFRGAGRSESPGEAGAGPARQPLLPHCSGASPGRGRDTGHRETLLPIQGSADTLAPRGGRRRRAAPADGGRQRACGGVLCRTAPKRGCVYPFCPRPQALTGEGGKEGAYKDIYPESWLLEHFLNTPSVPGGIHVLQEDDVWVINRDNRGASEMLASRSRACAVLRATRPPWGRAVPSAPAPLSALV